MLKPKIDDFELIIAIAEELSLSAAARRFDQTIASISHRLSKLEHLVGHKLVHRPKRIQLTDAGIRFYLTAKGVMDLIQEMDSDLQKMHDSYVTLSVVSTPELMMSDVWMIVEAMSERRPQLKIRLFEGDSNHIVRMVMNKTADIGLTYNNAEVEGIYYQKYRGSRVYVLVQNTHQMASMKSVALSDALRYRLIDARESTLRNVVDRYCEKFKIDQKIAIEVDSVEAQAGLVARTSLGIAIMQECTARRFESIYPVRAIPVDDIYSDSNPIDHDGFYICKRDTETLSPAAVQFTELLNARFSGWNKMQ